MTGAMKLTACLRTTLIACVACAIIPQTASAIIRLGEERALDTARFDSIEGFDAPARTELLNDTRAVPSRGGALLLHRAGFSRWFTQRFDGSGVLSAPREVSFGSGAAPSLIRSIADNDGMLVLFERWVSVDARELLAVRIGADGAALTAVPLSLGAYPRSEIDALGAACTVDACTVATVTASSALRLVRLDASGSVRERTIPTTALTGARLAVAASATDTMIALFESTDRVRLVSISSTGDPRPSSVIASYNSGEPRLVHDGFSFVLQYTRRLSMTPFVAEERVRRIRDDGGEFSPLRDVSLGDARSLGLYAMFRDGDVVRLLVGTGARGPIQSVTFDRADGVSAPALWATERALEYRYGDAVLPLASGYLVQQRQSFGIASPLSDTTTPVLVWLQAPDRSTRRIAPGFAAPQRSPRIVRDGSVVDVLWSESRDAAGQLFRRRFFPDGSSAPTAALAVETHTLRLACFEALRSGGELFVSWRNALDAWGAAGAARVAPSGAVRALEQAPGSDVFSAYDRCPQLYDSGGLITWAQHGARQVLLGTEDARGYFDTRWNLFGGDENYPLYMASFVSGAELELHWRGGETNRRARVALSSLPVRATTQLGPRAFGDPLRMIEAPAGRRLAVWRDGAWLAQRFDATSAIDAVAYPLGAPPNTTLALDRSSIELAQDRASFFAATVVATPDGNALQISRVPIDGPWSVESIRVTPPGVDVEGWSMLVEADGRVLVAYGRRDAAYGSSRVFTREVLFDEPVIEQGATCTRDAQCGSGACVDGVCCDRPCADDGVFCGACASSRGASRDGVCTPVECPSASVDGSVDVVTDASVDAGTLDDVVTRDAQRRDVVGDRVAVDAGRDGSALDAGNVAPRLGGGCQCAVAAAGDRRAIRGRWLFAAGALAMVLARRRVRAGRARARR